MKKAPKAPATLLTDDAAMSSAIAAPEIPLKAAEDGTIHLAGDDGHFYAFPAESASNALQQGFRPLTPTEEQTISDKKTYGDGVVNSLEAGALGFLRGSTFGLSDLALRALEPKWADAAENLKKYHKTASTVGELSSFVVPALAASKVAGVAGKAIGSTNILQKLVAGGADELGTVAGKIVGENLAGRAVGAGVKLGAEAAVYQAAHNISENSLEDKELTAESILAGTGQAAILGAGIGAALPVLAYGAQKTGEKILGTKAAHNALNFLDPDRSTQLFTGAMSKELNPETGMRFQDATHELRQSGLYGRGKVELDPATATFMQSAEGGLPSQVDVYARAKSGLEQTGKAIGDVAKSIDEATIASRNAVQAATRWTETDQTTLAAKIQQWASADQISAVQARKFMREVETIGEKVNEKAGSIELLHKLRKGLDSRVGGKFGQIASEEVELFKTARTLVSEKISAGIEAAAQDGLIDAGAVGQWQSLNRLFGNLKTVAKPLARGVAKAEANTNVLGLRFRDIGIGAVGGGVLGGPAGVALAVANRAVQTDKGLLWRAELGEKLQKLAWAEKLTNDGQRTIADGLKAFLKGDSAGAVSEGLKKYGTPLSWSLSKTAKPQERTQTQQQWFDDTKKQLMAFAADTNSFAENQGDQLQSLADHAPQLADTVLAKQMQIHAYLLQAMPKNPAVPLSVKNDKWKPADYQVQDFRRVVQVSRSPLSIMNDLRSGTATQSQVQAVKTLYPRLYDSILTQVRALVDSDGAKLSYTQQLKLGQLFPGSIPTMQPGFVSAMQSPASKPEDNKPRPPGGQVQFSQRRQTSSERSEAR